jgi:uncharacterized membrane protein (UPF0127 family)
VVADPVLIHGWRDSVSRGESLQRRKRSLVATWRVITCVAILGVAAACNRDADRVPADRYAHLVPFDSARIRIISAHDTVAVAVELAESEEQHTMGLMERQVLPADAGMLFLYPTMQPDSSAFWMFRTRLPLDIAFVDSAGVIRTIKTMAPCPTTLVQGCPSYPADARYLAALEVNAGYFARRQVRVDDRLVLQDTVPRRRALHPPA